MGFRKQGVQILILTQGKEIGPELVSWGARIILLSPQSLKTALIISI